MKFTARQAVNYFHKHFSVYDALYGLNIPVDEEEFLALVHKHAPSNDPSTYQSILSKSIDFGILEALENAAVKTYELSEAVSALIEHFGQSQSQVTSELIAGYLQQLGRYVERLEATLRQDDDESAILSIRSIDRVLDRIRNDSRNSCRAVLLEAVNIKSSLESTSLRERYTLVNHLWDNHVAPLQEVIDINAAIDSTLGNLSLVLDRLDRHFRHVSAVHTRVVVSQSKLRRMREQTFNVYREAKTSLEPLYKKVQRDGLIAVGAARYLSMFENRAIADVLEEMPDGFLSHSRNEGLFEDFDAEAFTYELIDYRPDVELVLSPPGENSFSASLSLQDVLGAVFEQSSVDDLAKFVEQHFDDSDSRHFFDALCTLAGSGSYNLVLSDEPIEFNFHGEKWRGHSVSLTPQRNKTDG